MGELGYKLLTTGAWTAFVAPKDTPPAIIAKLHEELKKAVANPAVTKRITADAGVPMDMPLADIEPMVKAELAKWADVVKRANITIK